MEHWGWSLFFEAGLRQFANCAAGRVASESRGLYAVWLPDGEQLLRMRGSWGGEPPVAGDWVAVRDGRIEGALPRRTKVSRLKAGRGLEEQVLAANVDVLLLVSGLDHDFNLRRIERYLLLAAESGAAPVVILNKADVCDDPVARLQEIDRIAPNVPAVLLTALDEGSVAQLHRYVEPGQTAVLLGSSGVGKSTIVNSILRMEEQATAAVREQDSRGRHTTTGRQLFRLNEGWLLLDTPGLRELEPWASVAAAEEVFADIAALATECRFRDCRHQGEPGCAVVGAVDDARLASLHKLQREMQALAARQDVHAALEQKRKWKVIHKAQRQFYKR